MIDFYIGKYHFYLSYFRIANATYPSMFPGEFRVLALGFLRVSWRTQEYDGGHVRLRRYNERHTE
jgi:hypothetical protein